MHALQARRRVTSPNPLHRLGGPGRFRAPRPSPRIEHLCMHPFQARLSRVAPCTRTKKPRLTRSDVSPFSGARQPRRRSRSRRPPGQRAPPRRLPGEPPRPPAPQARSRARRGRHERLGLLRDRVLPVAEAEYARSAARGTIRSGTKLPGSQAAARPFPLRCGAADHSTRLCLLVGQWLPLFDRVPCI